MKFLFSLSRIIDYINTKVGQSVIWLTLVVVLVSAINAVVRKVFSVSSNAWLELQWYLFGAIFLLAAGYTFLRNEHVRVDVLSQMLSKRTQIKIEIFGVIFFLLPACCLIFWLSLPFFYESFVLHEQSSNTGGLTRWPVKILIPIGFFLLILAGVSHLIKCIGYLRGMCPDPTARPEGKTAEQELADEIARQAALEDNAGHETLHQNNIDTQGRDR
ncbi:TRAP transporter small permease subunit [Allopusillimonas ginsengisoli]|uniref:TRAP transporter small permease subunit n=1 Tax=Allopusillimonas ginsengisoli TaxID=453575 RepID=UPI00101F02F3|nr:TRAP transporter small permease subunit [Allopusillimonas ginsengisoli]TEA70350.1 TRAP transporter small permease subunit [Allopusillimonas ginsengisoli]